MFPCETRAYGVFGKPQSHGWQAENRGAPRMSPYRKHPGEGWLPRAQLGGGCEYLALLPLAIATNAYLVTTIKLITWRGLCVVAHCAVNKLEINISG